MLEEIGFIQGALTYFPGKRGTVYRIQLRSVLLVRLCASKGVLGELHLHVKAFARIGFCE